MKPTKHQYTILNQICKIIPRNLVSNLAKKYGVDKKARTFTPWSHVVSLIYSQLAHSLSLNDVCDSCRNNAGSLSTIRGAKPPSRSGLSHSNKVRDGNMAEELFWQVLSHMQNNNKNFGIGQQYSGLPHRFKRAIYAVDSTTIKLVVNCVDWAKHRRRKAAAKCHLKLDLQTFLPKFAIVKAANTHDSTEAKELCANLKDGEVVVFDKAYIDFPHLHLLDDRGVFWVTRSKVNMNFKAIGQHKEAKNNILQDDIIELVIENSKKGYPKPLRFIKANVEINGVTKEISFITNNFTWASSSICDLYKSRWGIEVFFKQIKQTLQLADFLGHSENAIKWQIWTALLCYILLRYIAYISKWKGSFRRLFTLLKGVLFRRLDMFSVLEVCSNPRGSPRMISSSEQTYFPWSLKWKNKC